MVAVNYEEIFNDFLGSVTDFELMSLDRSRAYEIVGDFLHKSMADPYVSRLFTSYNLDDETQVFSFELERGRDDVADLEFVKAALVKWMAYEWVHGRVRNITNISQAFMGKDQKFYSQAQHLSELRGLQDDLYREARYFILSRGYVDNSYLNGGV